MSRRTWILLLVMAMLAWAAMPAVAGDKEYADVLGQGEVGVHAKDGASLNRTGSGLGVKVTMPTPAPGTYVYPDGAVSGHPEVFTAWAFVFNYPGECTDPCGADDIANPDVGGAVYNVAGHWGAGRRMTLGGHIEVGEPSAAFGTLTNPAGAEVHVAIAPHGWVPASQLPGEFTMPAGSPFCGCWYVSIFK